MDQEYFVKALRAAREGRERLQTEVSKLEARQASSPDPGVEQRLSNLRAGVQKLDDRIYEGEESLKQQGLLRELANNPNNVEAGTDFGTPRHPAGVEAGRRRSAAFREAQHVLEDHVRSAEIPTGDADRIDGVLRGGDLHHGVDAQYVAAAGQRLYRDAFAKLVEFGDGALLRMTPEEHSAFLQVQQAEKLRAMAVNSGSTGGFALPISLDPTFQITNAGSISPIRRLASQVTISTHEYRDIVTAGVVAGYGAEATEASDDSPTLAQPDVFAERGFAFVPFSIEVGMDVPNFLEQLTTLLVDGKTLVENAKFVSGAGPTGNEPLGLVTGLGGSSVVTTNTSGTWAVGDTYATQDSLAARWHPNAQWLMSLSIFNTTRRLVASADATEPQIVSPDGKLLLSKPWNETSDMSTAVSAGNLIAVYGDVNKAYRCIDRVGASIELISHLFGASRRPTGQRGAYLFWRGTGMININEAARVVKVHA